MLEPLLPKYRLFRSTSFDIQVKELSKVVYHIEYFLTDDPHNKLTNQNPQLSLYFPKLLQTYNCQEYILRLYIPMHEVAFMHSSNCFTDLFDKLTNL